MKKLLVIIFFFSVSTCIAQNFEGTIVYHNTYVSKVKDPESAQLNSLMGTTQKYHIKGGNYKSEVNGSIAQWQMYRAKENKMYYKMTNSDIILWNDASTSDDSILKIEIRKNAATILGYPCDELTMYCKSGIQKYYYNASIQCDPSLFAKHNFGNWNAFLQRTKALPLKMVINNAQFSMESIATEVKPAKLDDSIFSIPANAILHKANE